VNSADLPGYDPAHGFSVIRHDSSEELHYIPAKYWVLVHKCPVVVYTTVDGERRACTVTASGKVLPKSSASTEILAKIAVDRLDAALTLYRIERRFKDAGCPLSRSTLCTWMMQLGWLLEPIQSAQEYEIRNGFKIHLDDTNILIQDKEAGGTRKEKIWVFLGGAPDHPEIVFKTTASRTKDVVLELLSAYRGYLQVDACSVYDELFKRGMATEVGCFSHVFRKFYDIKEVESRARPMLRMISRLADVEDAAKTMDAPARKEYRLQNSQPILTELKAWVEDQREREILESSFKKALNYVHNQWENLIRYLEDGRLSMDNNVAESEFHVVGVTRRNHLFWSKRGLKYGLVLFGLIRTCRKNEIDPYEYLCDLIPKVSAGGTPAKELIPTRWKQRKEEEARGEAEEKAKANAPAATKAEPILV